MAGEENLIPMSERSKEEVRELAAKGGRKSGETRRRKKTMRENLEILLSMPLMIKSWLWAVAAVPIWVPAA